MILVPYETLVPEMTDDFKQKTKFSGARISMAQSTGPRTPDWHKRTSWHCLCRAR
jgi:hypothetical protein